MKKVIVILTLAVGCWMSAVADNVVVKNFKYKGPYETITPFIIDSTDVNGKKFEDKSSLFIASFTMQNTGYTEAKFNVKGISEAEVFADGNKVDGTTQLTPNIYNIEVKYYAKTKCDSLRVEIEANQKAGITILREKANHRYDIGNVLHAKRFGTISMSADGKWLIEKTSKTLVGGQSVDETTMQNLQTGSTQMVNASARWMPKSAKYYYTKSENGKQRVFVVDPRDGKSEILADNLPEGVSIEVAPTEDWLLLTTSQEGPKENDGVFEVIEPEDRQAGWRTRSNVAKYDLKAKQMHTLTYGHHNIGAVDISQDGQYILLMKSQSRLTERPTIVLSLYRLNHLTMQVDTLVDNDGFINDARFSPDGSQVVIAGSPECLGGIGKNVRDGQVPSMIDVQLYLMDIDGKAKPMTKEFNPNVSSFTWSKYDGMIYFTAEDRDSINLFVLNPKDGKIKEVDMPEEMITKISMANGAPVMAWYGNSVSNSDRLYTMNTKKQQSTLLEDLSAENLKDVTTGKCKDWTFTNSKGETIYGRYYTPSDFDPTKKYPMIVNYYGGCSPTSRNFENRYPQTAYAELGYIVLIINPSGATGFGQEFSARHVNTAGKGPAEDIIEGTKQFCKEHDFVNAKKVGCIGASYGGFMTQYLLTQTDIFAAGISHAGISDHTSYWGEGYWGYSYSEVSMAGSYPWTRKDLYVDQSPLFNADKIHTPLLFVHGTGDTNVPVGESIQMYTALKLLGRETAMVLVKDENHWILDYEKRLRWQSTIYAWFAKWLQDNDAWWKSMYKKAGLINN